MNEREKPPLKTVSARLERDDYERFTQLCKAHGMTRSTYIRTMILREIDGGDVPRVPDPITTVTLGAIVANRLLAAVPPDILDQAVARLRQEGKAPRERKKGSKPDG